MKKNTMRTLLALVTIAFFGSVGGAIASAQGAKSDREPRARDLGVPFEGTPGPLNSITDVKGVEVGYRTLISGEGKLLVGTVRFAPA